jgi:hypothetical protein
MNTNRFTYIIKVLPPFVEPQFVERQFVEFQKTPVRRTPQFVELQFVELQFVELQFVELPSSSNTPVRRIFVAPGPDLLQAYFWLQFMHVFKAI